MKVALPKGWFVRLLQGGWVLLILGIGLAFVTVLAPRAFDLVTLSRPVIPWNEIAVLINFLSVGAYFHFTRKETLTSTSL